MNILKLKEVGDEATLTVMYCKVTEGQYGEQVEFGDAKDTLFLPRSSADRQLERLGFGDAQGIQYQEVEGATLRFYRAASNKPGAKPFWNIDRLPDKGNGAIKPTATPEKPRLTANVSEKDLPPLLQGAEKEDVAELQKKIGFDIATIQRELALYQSLTEWVNSTIAPIYQKSGVGMSPESAVAATATLFINAAGKK